MQYDSNDTCVQNLKKLTGKYVLEGVEAQKKKKYSYQVNQAMK